MGPASHCEAIAGAAGKRAGWRSSPAKSQASGLPVPEIRTPYIERNCVADAGTFRGALNGNDIAMMRLLARAANVLTFLSITFLGPAIAAADTPFTFDATPGKLPKTVVPIRYSIELSPDVQNLTFVGSQAVDIEVRAATDTLVLHAVDLTIASASIEGMGAAASIALDDKAEIATIAFPQTIAAGQHRLHMSFAGRINSLRANRALYGRGLFAADYQAPGGRKRMIATNLEPAEARRIFPAWDEPSFKAIFELHVTVPDKFLAVSNMPVAREQPAGDGLKRVSFEPTPRMSSYLFVLAA